MTEPLEEYWLKLLRAHRPPLSENGRQHWAVKNRTRQNLICDAVLLARYLKLPRGCGRVRVTLVWNPPDRRRRDSDNPTPTLKACIDGLTRYGLTEDDDSTHVESACVIGPVRKPGEVWLHIEVLSRKAAA